MGDHCQALLERALERASTIADLPALATRMTKRAVQVNTDAPDLHAALELENRNQLITHDTDEAAERRSGWAR